MHCRRAKIKNLAKKSLETGEDIDSIPESMRAYLAMQAMESGKSIGGNYFGRTGLSPFSHGGLILGDPNAKVCKSHWWSLAVLSPLLMLTRL